MWPLRPHHSYDGSVSSRSDRSPEVLAIMRNSCDGKTISELAASRGWDLTVVNTLDQGFSFAAERPAAVVILDRDLTDNDWRSTMRRLAQKRPKPCIILASSVMDQYLFDEVIKQGGFDVIAKPIQMDELRRMGGLAFAFWKNRWANQPNG